MLSDTHCKAVFVVIFGDQIALQTQVQFKTYRQKKPALGRLITGWKLNRELFASGYLAANTGISAREIGRNTNGVSDLRE